MNSIRFFRHLLRALLLLHLIINIQTMFNLKTGFSGSYYFSADLTGTSLSIIMKSSPTTNPIYIRYFNLALSTMGNFYNITNLAVANASYYYAKVRCSPYNQLNATNNSFLIYTIKQLSIITNAASSSNNRTLLFSYIGTNQTIQQVFYLTNSNTQIFLLNVNGNYTKYGLKYYNINTTGQNIITIAVANSSIFIKVIRNSGNIFLLFNTGIQVYQQSMSLNYVASVPFPTSLTSFTRDNYSMSVEGNKLAYAINDSITILNISNFFDISTIHQFNFNYPVDDIQLLGPIILINWNITNTTQYDLQQYVNTYVVYRSGLFNLAKRMLLLQNDTIVFTDDNFLSNALAIHTVTTSYPYNGTCLNSYYLSGSQCVKNLSYIPPLPPTPPASSIPYKNQTPSAGIQNPTTQSPIINQILFNIGRVLSVTSVTALSPRSFLCLLFFMDDLYYYRFHRIDYPEGVKMFMEKIDLIFLLRFTPEFIRQAQTIKDKLDQLKIKQDEKTIYNNFISHHIHNPESFYFLNSASEVYINNFLGCLITFLLTKMIYFIFYWINKKFKKGRKIMLGLKRNSRNWSFLMLILQANITKLGFQCSVQLLVPINFHFMDKINLFFCLFVLFSILQYSTYFLIIVYEFQNRKAAETLLTYSRYSQKSFVFETYSLLLRIFVRAIIQGLLIQNYFYQVVSLTVADGIFSLIVFLFRKQFCHKLAFLFFFLYCFLFFVLDLCFTLNFKSPILFINVNYDLITFIIACCIIAVNLLLSVFMFLYNSYLVCKKKSQEKQQNNSRKKAFKNQQTTERANQRQKLSHLRQKKIIKCTVCYFPTQINQQKLQYKRPSNKQNKFSNKLKAEILARKQKQRVE